jgi:hypothetical protein
VGHVGHDAKACTRPEAALLAAETVFRGNSPNIVELGRYEYGAPGQEEFARAMKDIASLRDDLLKAEPVRYCAVLHNRPREKSLDENTRGIYHALMEAHLPVEVVCQRNVVEGKLSQYKVLVIADAGELSPEAVEQIRRFVAKGGGLVTAFRAAEIEGLGELAGFRPDGMCARSSVVLPISADVQEGYWSYYRLSDAAPVPQQLKGSLLSIQADWMRGEFSKDCRIAGEVIGYDLRRVNAPFFNRRGLFPGQAEDPFLTLRKAGRGKVAYFTHEIGAAAWMMGGKPAGCSPELSEIIAATAKWAGGPLPVETDNVPPSVDVAVHYDAKCRTYTVFLVNLTTNPMRPVMRVKYVVPLSGLSVSLAHARPKVEKVTSVSGQRIECRVEEGRILLEVPSLDLYEALTVRLKPSGSRGRNRARR